ncbi:MAG: hypothetical protein ABR538_13970 [Candidatus Binatia bacterium]
MSSTFTSLLERIEAELAELDVKALLFYSVSACGLAVALGLWAALLYPPAEIWTREEVEAQTTMLEHGVAGFVFLATLASVAGMALLYRYRGNLKRGGSTQAPEFPEADAEVAASLEDDAEGGESISSEPG